MTANPKVNQAIKVVTVAGASILVLKSAMSLLSVKSPKEAVMPVVSILVGVAAFSYAMKSTTPEVKKTA